MYIFISLYFLMHFIIVFKVLCQHRMINEEGFKELSNFGKSNRNIVELHCHVYKQSS